MELQDYPLIVTVNQRLARALRDAIAEIRLTKQQTVWATNTVLPWSAWMRRLWREDLFQSSSRQLLTPGQCNSLWEIVIQTSDFANDLLHLQQTTRLVSDAWQIMHEWQITADQTLTNSSSLDQQVFQSWCQSFQNMLDENGWITPDQIPTEVMQLLDQGYLTLPQDILWAGFDLLTPQQRSIQQSLIRRGCENAVHVPQQFDQAAKTVTCQDELDELRVTAEFTRKTVQQQPDTKIGIVVPELQSQRDQVMAIFTDTLAAQSDPSSLFNISIGESLGRMPLIRTAMTILQCALQPLSQEGLSELLRSAFIGEAEAERLQRAKLDAHLRQLGLTKPSWQQILAEARAMDTEGNARHWQAPAFAQRFEHMIKIAAQNKPSGSQSLLIWFRYFESILHAAGWPGQRVLNSEEFQTHEAWSRVGESWLAQEVVLGQLPLQRALQEWQKVINDDVFKAESPPANVQIMGMLEATDLHFDVLLVLGLSDQYWPAKVSANPFLPRNELIDKAMPLASANGALFLAQQITERLAHAAPQVLFTYPGQSGDQAVRPSALIEHFPVIQSDDLITSRIETAPLSIALDAITDYVGPPLVGDEVLAPGGASLLKDQAACPFRAFARHRLFAKSLEEAELALSAAERGSLVHMTLERVWGELHDQSILLSMAEDTLDALIDRAISSAINALHSQVEAMEMDVYQNIERFRLHQLINSWLEIERDRDPFTVIAREEKMPLKVGRLLLSTRVDRIDQLENDTLALIDYKTSSVTVKSWEGERPDDPQLPLYAVCMHEPPESVLFASLKKGNQHLVGLSANEHSSKKVTIVEDWHAQLDEWRVNLERLADEFCAGEAWVDPKQANTCQYCDLHSVCRVDELAGQASLSDDASAGEQEHD